jgi:DNA-binding LytR/AlgR family response regulator
VPFLELVLGIRRYGRLHPVPVSEEEPDNRATHALIGGFADRLPPQIGRDIVAVKAEDHYLRVYTRLGDALVLYRLGDAIAELERAGVDGLRTHRSFWVARAAVTSIIIEDRSLALRTFSGLVVPVSQTYKESVRRAGFATATRSEDADRPGAPGPRVKTA